MSSSLLFLVLGGIIPPMGLEGDWECDVMSRPRSPWVGLEILDLDRVLSAKLSDGVLLIVSAGCCIPAVVPASPGTDNLLGRCFLLSPYFFLNMVIHALYLITF